MIAIHQQDFLHTMVIEFERDVIKTKICMYVKQLFNGKHAKISSNPSHIILNIY